MLPGMTVSFLSPKAQLVDGRASGIEAVAAIRAGETVAAFGGRCVDRDELEALPSGCRARSIQIGDELYLAAPAQPEPADFVGHSCTPNCALSGTNVIVADRDIAVGEALTYDRATTMGDDADEFECHCGSAACRGTVTGRDWMLPELQLRYRGRFSPYLAARISALAGAGASRRSFSY